MADTAVAAGCRLFDAQKKLKSASTFVGPVSLDPIPVSFASSAIGSQRFPYVGQQLVRFLECGEVSALLEFGPADDVIGLLGESADRLHDVFRKDCDSGRDGI
ncbi:Uncharacterised protein [Mycobacteroides abscessus subsp. abscessus]|nr:Uncharacterised protein [Mycobacteroides abscessus subsp. abscessus]